MRPQPLLQGAIAQSHTLRRTLVKKGATLGANCTIVCGVTIGSYAFVGAGSVVTRDHALHHQLLMCHMRLGLGVSGNDTELVLRGLNSMVLRYQAQDAATRDLAAWMQNQPGVLCVLHPALEGSPGHEAWARDASRLFR